MEVDDRQMTTVFTVQLSFHHRHSTNRVSRSKPSIMKRYHSRRTCSHTSPCRLPTICGLPSTDDGMTVGLWKLSSLDGRRPPWYWPQFMALGATLHEKLWSSQEQLETMVSYILSTLNSEVFLLEMPNKKNSLNPSPAMPWTRDMFRGFLL